MNGGFENGLAPWVTTDIRAVGSLIMVEAHLITPLVMHYLTDD